MKVKIKPLSVNQAWQGKRYKTPKYKAWEKELLLKLKPCKIDLKARLSVFIEFGYSSSLSDIDNGLKPFLDVLQKKYKFNDRNIYSLEVRKTIVKKGSEFIKFNILELTE